MKTAERDRCTHRLSRSAEDGEHGAAHAEFASLSRLDEDAIEALLETGAPAAYCPRMADTSPEAPVPPGWRESLARSKAQIAAGESVPLLPVLDRLRASAERLEAEQGVTADGEEATAGG